MTIFEWFETADSGQLTGLLRAALSARFGSQAYEAVTLDLWRRNKTADICCDVEGGAAGKVLDARIRVAVQTAELFDQILPLMATDVLNFVEGSQHTDRTWSDARLARVELDAAGITGVVSAQVLADGSLLYRLYAIGPIVAVGMMSHPIGRR